MGATMAETVIVASRCPVKLRIHSRPVNPDKPGFGLVRTVEINGARHPDFVTEAGITHGVDARLFREWMEDHPEHEGVMWEMTPEEFQSHQDRRARFGFEAA
jgi:hypothetical protein